MDTTLIVTRFLFGALALVMFGLGLSLSLADFRRLFKHPKAVTIALLLQVIGLPLACYAIIVGFGLSPVFAIGLMLLAASPGGISANLFSHLFGGNVAMNISLTAVNTLLSIVTLPLIANWAIGHFAQSGQVVPLQTRKLVEVIAIVMVPVAIGMFVASRKPGFAARMEKPTKIFSAVVLAVVTVLAIANEWKTITATFAEIGIPVLLFNLVSLLAGYYLSRAAGLDKPLATAISYEIGIHNSTLAIFIAVSVLGSFPLALPAAIYSVVMYITAPLFGWLLLRRGQAAVVPAR
ncbi:BASS family bile acid:Na+ symporter [Variovorax boronicumulans]|jgi:BASS family bile acid:Na+ symporter|uniref:BASS family bile acid:Na+ symporter n=1 Tax=Variovorax boronicumulans TaxID=436515 RepID=A0AAW8CXU5_9BURK|nr:MULTISPECIES: bile acid:sodium symporter family protein [Variovorax]MDP9893717.1 BASS family bile acid:Na+ symporter [Variovorax boronicumulans]MDQ0034934.1 BASS family bile acid:Na+ symporter [Variovorax boronicumulans]MDQ0053534.1 BASS family bile acid:Na+ symporter [Variovorax boronicumulans]MDQ0608957.1 BASS family bile acid:Na+ symporter [Variovorax sp. W1I1]